ncbi:MAG TPA: Gfo/Idh/MocA family oxidoreductase, partial [Actinopolymorphaceae bacterium]|nr:Gfo/Idh/MocA family oxidoreductase [Actinopolymorphaceae bacterium]
LVAEQYVGALGHVRVDFRKWANTAPAGTGRHYKLAHPLLYDMAIHHFDLMRMILRQEPVQVFAQVTDPPWSRFENAGSAALTLTFDGGTVVSYRGSWVSSGAPTTWAGEWHLECEKGEIYWTGRAGGVDAAESEVVQVRRLPSDGGGDDTETLDPVGMAGLRHVGRAGAVAEFARAIAAGDEPETSGRRNLASLAVSEAAARSVESGQVEPVEVG